MRAELICDNRRIEGIVFDVDGTLSDSIDAYYRIFAEVTAGVGVSASRKEVIEAMASGLYIWDCVFSPDIPNRDQKIEQCTAMLPALFQKVMTEVQILPCVPMVLHSLLGSGIALGVATSSWRLALRPLQKAGLMDLFSGVITGDDGFAPKPAPDSIIQCLRRMGVDPAYALTVGDTAMDIQAGKAAGTLTVGVLSGAGTRSQLEAENPWRIITSIIELPSLLGTRVPATR